MLRSRAFVGHPLPFIVMLCMYPVISHAAPKRTPQDFPAVDQLPEQASLPDVLKMFDGAAVTTPEAWREQRRPELLRLFQWYVYGAAPAPPTTMTVRAKACAVLDGQAQMKQISIHFGPAGHEREGRVLGTFDAERSAEPLAAVDNKLIHAVASRC